MNQDSVKNLLLSIEEPETEFTVTFTGKESSVVNGLYKPLTHEILIHNKNFQTDGQLVYTAIHEYAHHLHGERRAFLPGARAHTSEFWAIFHALLEKAEAKNLYKSVYDSEPDFVDLTARIKAILPENGSIMLAFGKLVVEAEALCKKHYVRFEDYLDRAIGVPRTSATVAMKAFHLNVPAEIGWDAMKVVAQTAQPAARSMALEAFRAGKSQDTVKAMIRQAKPEDSDTLSQLDREKTRLEKTIKTMQQRLASIEQQLAALEGKRS